MRSSVLAIAATGLLTGATASANLLIAYGAHSAGLFSDSGELLVSYGNDFNYANSIVADSSGNVFISDQTSKIRMYNGATGAFIRDVLDDTSWYQLTGLVARNNSLVVTTSDAAAVLDPRTTSSALTPVTPLVDCPDDPAYRAVDNSLLVASYSGQKVVRLDPTTLAYQGDVISLPYRPTAVTVDGDGVLYTANYNTTYGQTSPITRYDFSGPQDDSFITGIGYVTGLTVGDGKLFVSDSTYSTIRTYSLSGESLGSFDLRWPEAVTYTLLPGGIPEPAALPLLAIGCVVLLGRWRHGTSN